MKKWHIIKSVIVMIVGIGFMSLENAVGIRYWTLMVMFGGLFVLPFIRSKLVKRQSLFIIIDLVILIVMGQLSRYVINYYIYVLLMITLLEVGLMPVNRWNKYIMGSIVLVTLYNYGVLYYYRSNLGTVSEIVFMMVINGLIVFSLFLIHQNRKEKDKQEMLNQTLLRANDQIESLTSIAVKNNVARDIHDTFGHDMMALIMEIEMAELLMDKEPLKSKEMLQRAKSSARQGMKTIRKVVETLRNEETMVLESIESLIETFKQRLGIEIVYQIDPSIEEKESYKEAVYRLIQECMTNSVRHGEATRMTIELKKGIKTYVFRIWDNGKGSAEIVEGFGLKGMRERIQAHNGKLTIKSDEGFLVEGYIEVTDD